MPSFSDEPRIREALTGLRESGEFDSVGASVDDLVELVAAVVAKLLDDRVDQTGFTEDADDQTGQGKHAPPNGQLSGITDTGSEGRGASKGGGTAGESTWARPGRLLTLDEPASDPPLTTTRAAGLLGMSRPYLIKLLDQGVIPFHRVGRDRRIKSSDVRAYIEKRDAATRQFREDAAASAGPSPEQ